ncbi:MAG: hypothetical protein LBI19_00355 [Oscillospiraceae bacterium]|jgi:tRNA nucleotidyltransferase (CCA-adding enzyme)|nr:hypothetical protein [Oscillospiraceae bacterium]
MAALVQRGHKAYAVGGCIRDSLLGVPPGDWDIATSALPQEVLDCLGGEATGLKYGTVTVQGVQVTTFRREGAYSDHRRPDKVEFVGDLETDLARRDFTVNAMAVGMNGTLIDLFDGQEDLTKKLIRAVGNPHIRFMEDALRILRALRFASVLDFALEEETRAALLSSIDTLRFLTKKVTAREVEKLRAGMGAERIMREYAPLIPALDTV